MKNQDIRKVLAEGHVKYWELADKCGRSASWLSVKLRKELTSEEKYRMFTLIQEIIDEREVSE